MKLSSVLISLHYRRRPFSSVGINKSHLQKNSGNSVSVASVRLGTFEFHDFSWVRMITFDTLIVGKVSSIEVSTVDQTSP